MMIAAFEKEGPGLERVEKRLAKQKAYLSG
jgi:hypothetical protein